MFHITEIERLYPGHFLMVKKSKFFILAYQNRDRILKRFVNHTFLKQYINSYFHFIPQQKRAQYNH